jgi:hypothetical protein
MLRKSSFPLYLMLAMLAFANTNVFGQATNGAGVGKPVVSVSYYKLPPGRQDEWLALYKKWHYPIMQYQKEHGQVISETVYTRAEHHISPSWDIAIMIIAPPADKKPKAEKTRGELIRSLFPDLDEYVKGRTMGRSRY